MAHLEVKPRSRSGALIWIIIIILVAVIAAAVYYFMGEHDGKATFARSDTTKTTTP
jgi:hypothetical protein